LLQFPGVKTKQRDWLMESMESETSMNTGSELCLIFSADMPERQSDDAKHQQ
jgi:hypothetical protein